MVRLESVSKSFGSTLVIDNISLQVRQGEVISLIGASGSGKTTILRCVNALEQVDRGRIFVDGQPMGIYAPNCPPSPLPNRQLDKSRSKIGMVFQRFNLFPHLTAVQNVMVGPRYASNLSTRDAREIALNQLARVGLSAKAESYPRELSGGQQQRVAIARALAMQPKLILFDEPTSALDPELVGEVLAIMRKLASDGMTMLVVTHEMQFARETASRVLYFDGGRILEDGSPQQVFENPSHERTQRFLKRVMDKE